MICRTMPKRSASPGPEQRHGLAERAADAASDLAERAADIGERLGDLGEPITDGLASAGAAAGRLLGATRRLVPGELDAARQRRLRRSNRTPLPNLYDLRPEARVAARRELGTMTIPVAAIRGSAVDGPAQRGGDFLPLPPFRSNNWRGRWQRLRAAQDRLTILPPIDVVQTPEGYWVTDGHNRVALALYAAQDEIDASVMHVHVPGAAEPEVHAGSLESVLADSRQVRAAGEGRLSRGASVAASPLRARRPDAGQEDQEGKAPAHQDEAVRVQDSAASDGE
jgi:hypothetical protein